MFRSQKQPRGRSRAFRSADRRNQAKEDFGGAVSGAIEREAEGESCGTEGDTKRTPTENRAAAGMESPHPVEHAAQPGTGAVLPQQPSPGKSAC